MTDSFPVYHPRFFSFFQRLIKQGAVDLVVPGNLPIGCSPSYLTLVSSPKKEDYNRRNGCLKALNRFSKYHNSLLQAALEKLRQKYPHAKIVYADYYGAAMRYINHPQHFGQLLAFLLVSSLSMIDLLTTNWFVCNAGFTNLNSACCGGGGPNNFNFSALCGATGSTVCMDPSTFASWDGIHLTEAAYRNIANGMIEGNYTTPPMTPPH